MMTPRFGNKSTPIKTTDAVASVAARSHTLRAPLQCRATKTTGSTLNISQLEYLVQKASATASAASSTNLVPPRSRAWIVIKTASVRKNMVGTSTSIRGTCTSSCLLYTSDAADE